MDTMEKQSDFLGITDSSWVIIAVVAFITLLAFGFLLDVAIDIV